MDSFEQPNPTQLLHNKAKAALALGEIYEANILIRKALDLDANESNIALAQEIKWAMGVKSLEKAQQYLKNQRHLEAYEEAQKSLQLLQTVSIRHTEKSEEHTVNDSINLHDYNSTNLANAIEAANAIISQIDGQSQRKQKIGKSLWIALVLILVFSISTILFYYQSYSKEQSAWIQVQKQENILAFQEFIEKNPQGKFANLAREALKSLCGKDDALWNSAFNPPDKSNLNRYLFEMQAAGGIYIEDAKLIIDSLDFDLALRTNTPNAIQAYIEGHPKGLYILSAKKLLNTLASPDEKSTILVYLNNFYNLYANNKFETLLTYFDEITPQFMDKRNLSQDDLLDLFKTSQRGVIEERINLDSNSYSITKDSTGSFFAKFELITYRKVKQELEVVKKKGRRRVIKTETKITAFNTKQSVEIVLNSQKKFIKYSVRLLTLRKEDRSLID